MSQHSILIFAKIPRTGYVKTRLITSILSDSDVNELYQAFLKDTTNQALRSVADTLLFSVADTQPISERRLSDIQYFGNNPIFQNYKINERFHIQEEGSFGERMRAAISWVFSTTDTEKLIVLGADSPQIQPWVIDQAFHFLDQVDVVLGPSSEGGIYLIGLTQKVDLNGIEAVFENIELIDFMSYINHQNFNSALLPELVDVDTEEDLVGLMAWIQTVGLMNGSLKPSQAKSTKQVIEQLGLYISADSANNRKKSVNKL